MPVDIFDHDNGIADQHPDTKGNPAQCHGIESEVRCIDNNKCGQDGQGNRKGNGNRGAPVAKHQ